MSLAADEDIALPNLAFLFCFWKAKKFVWFFWQFWKEQEPVEEVGSKIGMEEGFYQNQKNLITEWKMNPILRRVILV